jgi:clan AA aspartic protease
MTLIKGVVTPDREAVIDISVTGPTGIQATVTICVDTGFTDHLTLPIDLVRNLNLSYQQTYSGTLADGSLVPLDVYIADVDWGGQKRTVPVYATNGTPLLGMSMLYGSELKISVVDGGDLQIRLLP